MSESFLLSVQTPPVWIKPLEANVEVPDGEQLTLECIASGIPIPVMTCIKDKTTIAPENERIKMTASAVNPNETTFRLVIEKCATRMLACI